MLADNYGGQNHERLDKWLADAPVSGVCQWRRLRAFISLSIHTAAMSGCQEHCCQSCICLCVMTTAFHNRIICNTVELNPQLSARVIAWVTSVTLPSGFVEHLIIMEICLNYYDMLAYGLCL